MSIEQQIKKAQSLPIQRGEEWVMERRDINLKIDELEKNIVPQVLICLSLDRGTIVGATIVAPDVPESQVVSWSLECMLSPVDGEPRRPAHVTLVGLKPLQGIFEQVGVEVTARSLPHPAVDEALADLEDEMGKGMPPYLEMKGVTPEAVGDFFLAAAEFYQAKPWTLMEYEVPIEVVIEGRKPVQYWAVLMGMAEENYGLSLYNDFNDLMDILDSADDEEALDLAHRIWSMSFNYEKIDDIGVESRHELLTNGWDTADNEAYPSVLVIDPKGKQFARRPNAKELADLTVVTQALAHFFTASKQRIEQKDEYVAMIVQGEVSGRPFQVSVKLPAPELLAGQYDEDEDAEDDSTALDMFSGKSSPDMQRAMQMVDEALEEGSKSKRVKLLKQAIIICPECVDAYIELAEDARDSAEKEAILQQAVNAGRRQISEEDFAELEGQFWKAVETRPYVNARLRLAEFRADEGNLEGAIEDYKDLLRLISSDILRAREPLSRLLLILNRDNEVRDILDKFGDDGSAFYWYTRALLGYRSAGESPEALSDLKTSVSQNRHVVDYLLEKKALPVEQPEFYERGAESEAIIYTAEFLDVWKSTEGALKWLRKVSKSLPKEEKPSPTPIKKSGKTDEKSLSWDSGEDVEIWDPFIEEHPHFADVMDEDEVELEGETVSPRMHFYLHQIIENQLAQKNPPEAAETLQRLMDAGMTRHEAVHAIARLMSKYLFQVMKTQTPMDTEKYCEDLRKMTPHYW